MIFLCCYGKNRLLGSRFAWIVLRNAYSTVFCLPALLVKLKLHILLKIMLRHRNSARIMLGEILSQIAWTCWVTLVLGVCNSCMTLNSETEEMRQSFNYISHF